MSIPDGLTTDTKYRKASLLKMILFDMLLTIKKFILYSKSDVNPYIKITGCLFVFLSFCLYRKISLTAPLQGSFS